MNDAWALELEGDQERLCRLIQKRQAVQKGHDLESDGGRRFDYEQQLADLDKEIVPLKEKLNGLGLTPNPHYAWAKIFEQHQLRSGLSPSVTVNCNREEHYERILWEHFKDAVDTRNNLLYLIVACPYQRPASIAKRLVYEASKDLSIAHIRDAARDWEVAVGDLEFGLKPENSWKRLWEAVQKNRTLAGQPAETPDALAKQLADRDYIALVYRHYASTWNEKQIEHLRYIAGQLQNMPENSRKFLVFIAIEFLHIHDQNGEKYKNELSQLNEFVKEINADGLLSACVSLLPPVKNKSIENWCAGKFSRDGQNAFPLILKELEQETQAKDVFNMDQIEPMQEAAYHYSISRPRPDLPF
jgi:hypothetical protein